MLSLIGYQSNKATYGDLCQRIVKDTGSNVVVFNYSGHSDSPVDVTDTRPAQHFNEVVCVFDWAQKLILSLALLLWALVMVASWRDI